MKLGKGTMTRKLDVTRRGALGIILGAPGLIYAAAPALADASAVAGPGDSIYITTAKGSRYTWVKFANLGPGAAEIEIASRSFNDSFVIDEGGTVEMTEIFGTKRTSVTNKSATATVKIDLRWL